MEASRYGAYDKTKVDKQANIEKIPVFCREIIWLNNLEIEEEL